MNSPVQGYPFPDLSLVGEVLASSAYWNKSRVVREFLRRSRALSSDAAQTLALQVDMARELNAANGARKYFAQKAAESSNLRHQVPVTAARRIAHLIRVVADGIAWRTLGYDRARLYLLATKPQTGGLESIDAEIAVAERHVQKGETAILNDLTNWLRYGDITLLANDGLKIIEVKSGRAGASGRSSRQWKKLEEVAGSLRAGVRATDAGTERIYEIKALPKSYAGSLSELFERARAEGNAHGRLSDCTAVDVFSQTAAQDDPMILRKARNPFSESGSLLVKSLDFFHTFTAHIAPYSIFPLGDDDCADLMTGAIWVVTYFSLHRFKRCLGRRGLDLQFPSRSQMKAFGRLPLGEGRQRQADMAMTVFRKSGGPGCSISMADLCRLLYEFLDEESYADGLVEVFDQLASCEERWLVAFENEQLLWD